MIALAAGWGCFSLALLTAAEAHVGSVMLRFFAYLFLTLAVSMGSIALVMLLRRSLPPTEPERRLKLLRNASGATLLVGAWFVEVFAGALFAGFVILAGMIAMTLSMDHRVPPGGGSALT